MSRRTAIPVALGLCLLPAAPAEGQLIRAKISSTKCAPDEVLTLQVEVVNPRQATTPMPEASADFEIRLSPGAAQPAVFSRQTWENGRFSSSVTHTYTFDLRPLRAGRLTVPAFVLKTGGRTLRTRPITVQVGKRGGLPKLMCKVVADRKTVYVGQPVDLKLEIWVRKFRYRGRSTLDASATWSLGVSGASRYGIFADVVGAPPMYREDTFGAPGGASDEYFVFLWKRTVYPKTAGPLDLGDIVIAWKYPTEVGRGFFDRYRHLRNPRQLRATPEAPDLEVKPIPLEGRPPDYNGAIGRFTMHATARPIEAPVGDPITLTLIINGESALERVGAPKLDQVEALTRDFEISGESLAGEVQFDRKIFSVTIRALREDVEEIPPIPMSFFDPDRGRYETVWSDPIPVRILPVQRLALSPGAESAAGSPAVLTPLTETMEGLQANYTDVDAILADQSGGFGTGATIFLCGMPGLYLATWFVTRRFERFKEDVAYRRRRFALAHAKKGLRRIGRDGSASDLYGIVLTYIADRCNAPAGGLTRGDAASLLRERDVPAATREALDAFLESLEQVQYAGAATAPVADLLPEARRLIDELERCHLK